MKSYKLYEAAQKLNIDGDHEEWIINKYLLGESCNQISQEIFDKTGIYITPRGIGYFMHKHSVIRTKHESFINSIKTGRMVYKTKEKIFTRNGISSWLRFAVLERDNHKCVSCGSTDFLEVDHIVPVSSGGLNELENLSTLCRQCNIGKFHYNIKKDSLNNN